LDYRGTVAEEALRASMPATLRDRMKEALKNATRMAVVLDGDTGPGLAITRSLGRAGWTVLVPEGTRSQRSRYSTAAVSIPNAADEPDAFAVAVRELGGREDVHVLVPTTDASLAGAWAALGERERPRIVGGDRETVRTALDKVACLRAAERHGFPVPAWSAPETPAEAHAFLEAIGAPIVVKPRRSYVRRGDSLAHRRHHFVFSPSDLDDALSSLGDGGELPVVQEYVPGRALAVSAVIRDGKVLAAVARETFTFLPVRGGTSVWKRTVDPGETGVGEALSLLEAIGLDGVAEVEYQLGDDGVPRLMEIGARLHGWVPLAVAAGVDLPLLAARAAVGDPVEPVMSYRVGLEMRWPAGEIHRLRTLALPRHLLPPGMRRREIVRGIWPPWKPGMRYDGIDLGDLRPLLRRLRMPSFGR
jgi:carbamoyl-phosphate synthase large subunit